MPYQLVKKICLVYSHASMTMIIYLCDPSGNRCTPLHITSIEGLVVLYCQYVKERFFLFGGSGSFSL